MHIAKCVIYLSLLDSSFGLGCEYDRVYLVIVNSHLYDGLYRSVGYIRLIYFIYLFWEIDLVLGSTECGLHLVRRPLYCCLEPEWHVNG